MKHSCMHFCVCARLCANMCACASACTSVHICVQTLKVLRTNEQPIIVTLRASANDRAPPESCKKAVWQEDQSGSANPACVHA